MVALAVEGAGWLAKAATTKGKDVAPVVAKPFKKAESKVEDALGEVGTRLKGAGQKSAEAVERAMDERIAAALDRAGTPLMAEIGHLKGKVEELSKKIEALQSKREKAAH